MKTPIINLDASTPKMKLRLGTAGCDGRQALAPAAEMHIRQVVCGSPLVVPEQQYVEMCNGCPPMAVPGTTAVPAYTSNHGVTTAAVGIHLIYPALGIDDDGLTEFYFDDKLFQSPPGRYKASVILDSCSCMEFDINLMCDPVAIEQIVLEAASTCHESC